MTKNLLSRLVLLLVALGVVGAIVFAFRPQPVAVDLAEVVLGPLEVTVDEDGRTRIRDRYVVSAPLNGQLQRIELDAGDAVAAGETVVAVLEPVDPALLDARENLESEARVRRAQAVLERTGPELDAALARREHAAVELDRIQTAFNRNAATQRELDAALLADRTAREELAAARFAQEIARFELELAQAALIRTRPVAEGGAAPEYLTIRSPITGRVLRVMHESAAVVSPGSPIIELGDPADLEIEVDVLSTDAVQIRPGAPVHIERWGGERVLNGVVRLVEPQAFTKISALGVEEQRVNVIIDFADPFELWSALGDGYRVEARIVVWREESVLKVSAGSLFRRGREWCVFAERDGRAVLREVAAGRRTSLEVQIVEGLDAGERVIVHPSDSIEAGTAIVARAEP